ncbi:MAG TPA: hypothetical protein VF168_08695 [Trueperaceae bacterium]
MNWQTIKDDWQRLKPAAAGRWPRLDERTLRQIAGNRTRLMEALQDEYDLTLEEAGVEVDRWADTVSEHGAPGAKTSE